MDFIQFSFSNAYIYSPITWLHQIQTNYKIFIIFSFLYLMPYISILYLLIISFTFLLLILTLKFRQNYYYSCFIILVSIYVCLLPYCFSDVNHIIYNTVKIYIPYQIYNIFIKYKSLNKIRLIHTKTFIQLTIPSFIIQIGIISTLYSIILKTLLLTTMYEHIVLLLCMHIKIDNQRLKKTIFISCFASQFLEQMIKRIRIVYISIKLRNIDLILCKNKLSICYYIAAKFLNHLKYDIYNVSSILYSRELSDQNLEINILQS